MLEINNLTKRKVNEKYLQLIVEDFLLKEKLKKAELSLVFVADKRFKNLNNTYRFQDKVSDVLSFSNNNFKQGEDNFLGEIFINLREIARLYKYEEMLEELGLGIADFKNKKSAEVFLLYFIFVHGLLHLIGFNDETEAERIEMMKLGQTFLNNFFKKRKLNIYNLS